MNTSLILSAITLDATQLVGVVLMAGGIGTLLGVKFGRAIERTEAAQRERIARRYR